MEESREKGGEREVKKQGLMVKKLKRGMLVGKRGGPCTPPPTWRLELNDNNSNNNIQEFLTFPNPTTSTSISARKLCSNLWEIQPHHHCNGVTRPRRHQRRNKRFQISKHLVDPPNTPPHQAETASRMRRHVVASPIQHHQSVESNDCALQVISPSNYSSSLEVAPYNPAVSPTKSLDLKGSRMSESSYSLKTSTELLKVLNRIWSLEEQHASNISLVKALKMELYLSRARIKELLEEKHLERHGMDELMKQVTEDKFVRKTKEQDRIKAAVESLRDELEDERKLRKRSESLHRKLARELSELKSSFSNALRELERERKARILLENLCDEFAEGIRGYEQEVRSLKHKTEKDRVGRESPDRLILHISEAWLDERMQMKLAEARNDLAEKNTIVDKIGFDIETFLQAKQSIDSRKNGNLSLEELKKNCWRRHSLESFPLNETFSAPQNAADEGDSSTDGDSHCSETNKETDGNQNKGSCKQYSDNAAESDHKEIVKSNSIRKNVGLWEIDEVCNPSSLQGQFKEHMAKAEPSNGNKSQFPGRQQGEMGGEKQDEINYPETFGMCEATQEGLHERHGKWVGTCGLKAVNVPDNLIRNHSLSLEDDKIHFQSNCREDSRPRSLLTSYSSPVQLLMSKLTIPDVEKSDSTLRWPPGLKENTLLAKLLEARLEAQLSRSKASKFSF